MNKIRGNFSDFILKTLSEFGQREAIKFDGSKITFDLLSQKARRISNGMQIRKIDKLAICMDNKLDVLLLAIACMVAKIPFIIIDSNTPDIYIESILKEADITTIVCDIDIEINGLRRIVFDTQLEADEVQITNPCGNERVLFYIATSGSTGVPKIAERHCSDFWRDYYEFTSKYPYLCGQIAQQYAKLNFSYGLENSLLMLLSGTTVCLGGKNVSINDLDLMFEEIENSGATIIFWATPIIKLFSKHYSICERIPNNVRYIYTGGEPLVVSADFIVVMKNKGITIINDYGCSELGKLFACPYEKQLRDMQAYNMVGVGSPLKGYEALILDENLNEVKEGYLYLKSPERFPCSYVNPDIRTNEIKKKEYWLYNTKDIATRDDKGIVILGRDINSVNISGFRVELEQVEYAVNSIDAVEQCVAIPYVNTYKEAGVYCFFVGQINGAEIRNILRNRIPHYMIPTAFTPVDKIELLPNGKVDRKKNYEVFCDAMSLTDIDMSGLKERIYSYLVKIIGIQVGTLEEIYVSKFSDLGIDSLSIVDFISTVEEKEHVKIGDESLGTKIICLKDVVDLVGDSKRD